MKYMSNSSSDSFSNIETKSEFFLTKNVPNDEKQLKLVGDLNVPESFEDYGESEIMNLSIKDNPNADYTTDIIIEDVVVEYKSCAGEQQEFLEHTRIYLKSYVSVGIPDERYSWIFKKMNELHEEKVWWASKSSKDGYTWVTAQIPPRKHLYEQALCYAYSDKKNDTIAIGTITDVLTKLKTNIIGYGQFTIRVVQNAHGACVPSLILTAFQMVDLTKKQSRVKPCIMKEPSRELMAAFEGLNIV